MLCLAGAASLASAQSLVVERDALTRARAAAQAALARSARIEAAASRAEGEAEKARAQAAAIGARVQAGEADMIAIEARIALVERLRARQRAILAKQQEPTARLVAALQAMASRPAAMMLMRPGATRELVYIRAALASAQPVVAQRVISIRRDLARSRALRADVEASRAALAAAQADLDRQKRALDQAAVAHRRAAQTLARGALVEQDRALALGEEARDLSELIARIDDQAAVRARLQRLPGPVLRPGNPAANVSAEPATAPSRAARASYRLPAIGRVVSGMGEVSPTGVRARGLTIETRPLALVVAPTGGRVAFAGPFRGYGQVAILDHGDGWTTLLTGLATLSVRAGDIVDAGSPLGRSGRPRGLVTIELRRNGAPVDIGRLVG